MGPPEWLPLGSVDLRRQQEEATWRCFSGPTRMAAPGIVDTCARAAEGGHLEVLQWARQNGCPWDADTCAGAAQFGHLEVLQWPARTAAPGIPGPVSWPKE